MAGSKFGSKFVCLKSVNAGFDQAVKPNVDSADLDAHQAVIRRLSREYFKEAVASKTLQVSRLVDPEWLLEIEAIAIPD